MTLIIIVLSLVVGGAIGYLAFYFSYKDVKTIEKMKENLRFKSEEAERFQKENDELMSENDFIRQEAEKLQLENENLKDVVARVQGNNHIMEKLTKLSKEMANLLGVYDKEVEFDLKKVIGTQIQKREPEDEIPPKKFF